MYLISLPNRPYHPVTISFLTLSPSTLTTFPPNITILPQNWNVPHELTVIALEDEVNRETPYPSGFKLALESEDTNYHAQDLPDLNVYLGDNDDGMYAHVCPVV